MEAFFGQTISVTESDTGNLTSINCTIDGSGGSPASATIDLQSGNVQVDLSGDQPFVTCTFTNSAAEPDSAQLSVSKVYTDQNSEPVDVFLSCTSGGPATSPQSADPDGNPAVFTVTGFEGSTTCTATESVPDGYAEDESDCASVVLENGAEESWTIENEPVPANLTLKNWS